MQHLEGSGTPVLYIGRTVLKGQNSSLLGCNAVFLGGWVPHSPNNTTSHLKRLESSTLERKI